jgi:hypothetical protein
MAGNQGGGGAARGRLTATVLVEHGELVELRETLKPKRGFSMGAFHVTFQAQLKQMMKGVSSAATWAVFMELPERLTWTEWRPLNQTELAAHLDVDQGSVSRALKDLLAREIIERSGPAGAFSVWRLSIKWGWNAGVDAFDAELKTRGLTRGPGPAPNLISAAEGILC